MRQTGSTNSDLVARAADGAPHGTVLIADEQIAGRGRLGRSWAAPPGTALLMSVLLRPTSIPPARRSWVGAILGLAIVTAIEERTGMTAELKWPNDVLIQGRKVCGILAEMAGDALVVGAGINVTVAVGELPQPDATSLLLAGAGPESLDRSELAWAILRNLEALLRRWSASDGDVDVSGIRSDYLNRSATVGALVTVHLPSGDQVIGTALDVAADGSIVIDTGTGVRRFTAGDVRHLRSAP